MRIGRVWAVRHGVAGKVGWGLSGVGLAWWVLAGEVGRGTGRLGTLRQARSGRVRRVQVCRGAVRFGRSGKLGSGADGNARFG